MTWMEFWLLLISSKLCMFNCHLIGASSRVSQLLTVVRFYTKAEVEDLRIELRNISHTLQEKQNQLHLANQAVSLPVIIFSHLRTETSKSV